jgi:hypothetical protein
MPGYLPRQKYCISRTIHIPEGKKFPAGSGEKSYHPGLLSIYVLSNLLDLGYKTFDT